MSRKGNCWDNTHVEHFFSSLKRGWTSDQLNRTRQEVIACVREYMTVYNNTKRLHSMLSCITLSEFENHLNDVSKTVDHNSPHLTEVV
jgi:transposase InsO family protein